MRGFTKHMRIREACTRGGPRLPPPPPSLMPAIHPATSPPVRVDYITFCGVPCVRPKLTAHSAGSHTWWRLWHAIIKQHTAAAAPKMSHGNALSPHVNARRLCCSCCGRCSNQLDGCGGRCCCSHCLPHVCSSGSRSIDSQWRQRLMVMRCLALHSCACSGALPVC
jgi:hypothetical protein